MQDLNTALETYFQGCQKIYADHKAAYFPENPEEPWGIEKGKKYAKIVHGGSVHSFVDLTTGDVLKAASWKAPAKHARGNILDAKNGLGAMGPYGPAYLR